MKASCAHLQDLQDEQATANDGDIRPAYLLDVHQGWSKESFVDFVDRTKYSLSLPRSQPRPHDYDATTARLAASVA